MDKTNQPAKMTKQQTLDHHMADFSFDKLLAPYREGGIESNKFDRSIGIIVDWLVNKKKFPVEIAGAAILCTFMELYHGKTFSGVEGRYGVAGQGLIDISQTWRVNFYTSSLAQKRTRLWLKCGLDGCNLTSKANSHCICGLGGREFSSVSNGKK